MHRDGDMRWVTLFLVAGCSASPQPIITGATDAGYDAPVTAVDATPPADVATEAPPPPPSPCGAAGLLLCDDFESGAIDASVWTASTNHGGIVEVTTTRAHGGTHSFHAHAPATGGADAHLTETKTFPRATLFGRAWFYLEPSVPVAHTAYFAANGPKATYTFASQDGTFMALAYFSSSETADHSATAVPVGHWACLEWSFDGSAGSADYWIDGVALGDMHEAQWAKDTFQSHDFGVSLFETDTGVTAYDAWFDDIAIGTERIGCP